MKSERDYIPAAGHDFFLPFYDVITKISGLEKARKVLLSQADLSGGLCVLDIGCGTGRLLVELKQKYPYIEAIGLDPDPKALARARRYAERAAVSVHFDQRFSDAIGYPSAFFDRVFSSFMFHHLPAHEKQKTLREVWRVLKAGGRFFLLDFEASEAGENRAVARLLHAHAHLKENSERALLDMLNQAGFADVHKREERPVFFGLARLGYYQSSAPSRE